jgi:hypothetical protein
MENWINVVDFEGIYEVSNYGNIRSTKTKQLKKITFDAHNRPYLGLWKNNKQKIVRPHKLVLEAFVGKAPQGMECCHNDGNQQNNRLENLRWDTPKNNHADKLKHGTSNTGERCNWAKLTKAQVIAIRADTRTQKEIAAEYGVQQSQISRIKNGVRWIHD